MLLKKWADKLSGGMKKISGRRDFLEAACASCALVAAADGDISDDEIKAATRAVTSNAALSASSARSGSSPLEAVGGASSRSLTNCCSWAGSRLVIGRLLARVRVSGVLRSGGE